MLTIYIAAIIVLAVVSWLVVWAVTSKSTEYLGGFVTRVRHYDEWDELVERTRQVPCGTDKDGHTQYRTETYMEVVEHPECWTMRTTLDKYERDMGEYTFDMCVERFDVDAEFVPMYRNYHTKDGNAQDYYWDGRKSTIVPCTKAHKYRNPFKYSNSIFRYSDIRQETAKEAGLYDYPSVIGLNQCPVVGAEVDEAALDELNYINAVYGQKYQFRLFVLIFPSKLGVETVEKQKGYWHGGNKNELVVCLGVNDESKVEWCGAFSWCDEPWLEVETRSWFAKNDTLDLLSYALWLEEKIPAKWHRKEFSDFQYVSHSIPKTAKTVICTATLLACVALVVLRIVGVL